MQRYYNKNLDSNLRLGRDGYYIRTKFGTIGVWNDDNGLYVDLCNNDGESICMMCLSEERAGLLASIYGDNTSGFPTHEHMFTNLKRAFENDIIIEDEGEYVSA